MSSYYSDESPSIEEDVLIWKLEPHGAFSIKSAWNSIRKHFCLINWAAKYVWRPGIPLKYHIWMEDV